MYIDERLYREITTDEKGRAALILENLSPGMHVLRIYHESELLYEKVFVVEGIPASISISGLSENREIIMVAGYENFLEINLPAGKYEIIISGKKFGEKKVKTELKAQGKVKIPIKPEKEGEYNVSITIFRNAKPYAKFTVKILAKSPLSIIYTKKVKKASMLPTGYFIFPSSAAASIVALVITLFVQIGILYKERLNDFLKKLKERF